MGLLVLATIRNNNHMSLFTTIAKSWKAFVTHKKLIPLAVLMDVLFIYGLTRLHYEVFNRASSYALQLTTMMSKQVETLAESETVQELAMLQSPEFIAAYHALVKYILIFTGSAFLVWLVAKGVVWFIAHKTVEKKTDARLFALKFFGMTLFWFGAFIALTLIALNLLDYALFGVFPLIGKTAANSIAVAFYWVLAYFVFISYALVPQNAFKRTFVLGWKAWRELLPVHIISSLIFFVATTVPMSLVKINIYLMLAFVILVALPALAWSRVFWITTVQRVIRHG